MTSSVANLVDEFQLLETVTDRLPESFSQKVLKYPKATSFYNTSKNRYKDILAKEDTRVCLQPIDGIPDSDYINANFVTYDTSVYICCQAPLPSTVHDFWRMVWEQEASIIVMLTDLYSKEGEVKAHCYWPSSTALYLAFGNLKIRLLEQSQEGEIWIRHFEITMIKDEYEEQRKLTQLQYIGWPDFSVPSTTTEFKKLLKMTDKYKDKTCKEDGGKRPIVVHCSAGIGRTGVYVAGRICLKHAKEGKQFSVFNIVRTLREQRTGMVQTPQQYSFLHSLINSYIPAKRRSLHFSSK